MGGITLEIPTAEVFVPLLEPTRLKGAYGGRGSGKSHNFADMMIDDAVRWPGEAGEGLRGLCFREVQKSLKDSAKLLIEDKIRRLGLGSVFKVWQDRIETPGDGQITFTGMNDQNAESVKSLEGYHRAWGEEAQTLSNKSINLLLPTIRWEDTWRGLSSEIWFSWNPRRKSDAVDVLLRQGGAPKASVVEANWSDNPWFPKVLEEERLRCLDNSPDQYGHIWEGDYATVVSGAYYAEHLQHARKNGRIGFVAIDPLMRYRAYWDIGGRGRNSDATTIWIIQQVGQEIRVLDYYEAVGQTVGAHVEWMRTNGYQSALCVLPHDGESYNPGAAYNWAEQLNQAGFETLTIKNSGRGAAMKRIEHARRIFPRCWFNEGTTKGGLEALGAYHAKYDDNREIDLGPEHDWASHGADSFGLMAIDVTLVQNTVSDGFSGPLTLPKRGVA